MKVKFIYIAIIVFATIFFSSCKKDQGTLTDKNKQNSKNYKSGSISDGLISAITSTTLFSYYDFFVKEDLGPLDFDNIRYDVIEEGGQNLNVCYIPTTAKLLNTDRVITPIPKATVNVVETIDGGFNFIIHDYSNINIYDQTAYDGYVSIKLMNNLEIYKIYKGVHSGPDIFETGKDLYLASESLKPTWWSCTVKCYKFAHDACYMDPQCALLCDIANLYNNSCNSAILMACAATCYSKPNFIYTPTTAQITLMPEKYKYGFYSDEDNPLNN